MAKGKKIEFEAEYRTKEITHQGTGEVVKHHFKDYSSKEKREHLSAVAKGEKPTPKRDGYTPEQVRAYAAGRARELGRLAARYAYRKADEQGKAEMEKKRGEYIAKVETDIIDRNYSNKNNKGKKQNKKNG